MKVYLAGPMEGLTAEQMTKWREESKAYFRSYNENRGVHEKAILTLDPTDRTTFHEDSSLPHKLVYLDELDVRNADVILINLSQMEELNLRCWGSICEMTLAHHLGKPVVMVLPKGRENHPFVQVYCTEIHSDLDSALKGVLGYTR